MKIAIVGATGLVGTEMLRVLESSILPVTELLPVGSEKSRGKILQFGGQNHEVTDLLSAAKSGCDVALFSAGGAISSEWAPIFAEKGTVVIDNSSAWRMHEGIPLVVPEINAHVLDGSQKIIANPNCSTIQMVMVLHPLHKRYGLKRLVISTYQSVSGTGQQALTQLAMESRAGVATNPVYPHPIYQNCLPHCDVFLENGYTREEMKLVHETRKILNSPHIRITATAVRVPVVGGHSESVNAEFETEPDLVEVLDLLNSSPGLVVADNPADNLYPMPLSAHGKDEVFVGRIRRDESLPNALNLWIVSDNLRKGAATNAVQIAEYLFRKGLIS